MGKITRMTKSVLVFWVELHFYWVDMVKIQREDPLMAFLGFCIDFIEI